MTSSPTPPAKDGGVARPLLVYTALRMLLFLAVLLLVRRFVEEPLVALGVAVLGSALLSVPLLRRFRHDLTVATAARAERRRAAAEARRARLDEG